MELLKKFLKYYMFLLGAFIVLMAFDCFGTNETFWYELACFGISILPGVGIILVVWFLRNKDHLLRWITLALAIGFFILFKMYRISDQWPIILIIFLPMITSSILSFINTKKA